VELLEDGIWLPNFGVSVNTVRGAAPALFTRVDALKSYGRKRGVLAPEHTWQKAFPSARSPKAPAPLNRDVRLGLMRVCWFATPETSGNAHIRIVDDSTNCVLIDPDVDIDHESIFEMMSGYVSTIVLGPVEEEERALLSLKSLASNWPDATFVLYGSRVRALSENSQLPALKSLEILVLPEQDTLF
jgi:hypothetical protein